MPEPAGPAHGERVGGAERRRARVDAERAGGLVHPRHAGCAGTRPGGPGPCPVPPAVTVAHRFENPRPHTVRLFACEAHAVGHPDPRALTAHDRAELRRRRRTAREGAARPRR